MSQEKKKEKLDIALLALVLILVVFGLVMLMSTSAYNGRVKFDDSAYYFKKQLFATALGLMAMYLISRMDYHRLTALAPACYVLALILSTAVLFFGQGSTMALRGGWPWDLCHFSPQSFPKWR